MAVISGGNIIEGSYSSPRVASGVPSAGTSEVQTLTIGGTPSGGTMTFKYEGATSTPVTWTATDATLVANIDAALEALPTIGTGGVTTAAGTVSSGIGTITITFAGNLAKQAVPLITVTNGLTGSSPTAAITETTPGVTATARGAGIGTIYINSATGIAYINTGTALIPVWTVIGAQT